jgi:hypothetical protein
MAKRLVLLDFRLTGMVSTDVGEVMQVSVRTPLKEAFDKVARRAREQGGLDDLLICCHGIHLDGAHEDAAMSLRTEGGLGLELCEEGLNFRTLGRTAVLKDPKPLVGRIVVFSCGAANTHAELKHRQGDGMRLMGELALTTGARVVASNVTQYFYTIPSIAQSLFNAGSRNDWRIDFGEWEGEVFEFSPDDGTSRKLSRGAQPRFDF